MRKQTIAALLCAAVLFSLTGCVAQRTERDTRASGNDQDKIAAQPSETEPSAVFAELPEAPQSTEARFPLLGRPFSDAESEEMANHNARRCALMVVNYFYARCLYADGSCALVRYEIIDNNLRHRTSLVPDCPADYLSERDGRLYYLNATGFPESVEADGTGRRVELDAACQSLQVKDDGLYCLLSDGTLLVLRGDNREAIIGGCAWAFAAEQGIFYTSAFDGRMHLLDPSARTDMILTSEKALAPMVIGTTLFFTADEADGRHVCALNLIDGTRQRMADACRGDAEFFRGWDGSWKIRLSSLGGASGQQTISCAAVFENAPSIESGVPDNRIRRCRGVDDVLRTDELLSANGTVLGFELVLPGGGSFLSLAEDNEPEK